nr:MAG TPA: hydrolase [Caudoviricetes sp.]
MSTISTLQSPWPPDAAAGHKFVAFIDILGFSNRVLHDPEGVLEAYQQFCESILDSPSQLPVEATVYSDAVMLVADNLWAILHAANSVWFFALTRNLVIRGGISYGRYYSKKHDMGLMVVSDALVRAVQLEKDIGVPAVALDDTIFLPDAAWAGHFTGYDNAFDQPLIHYTGLNIVNPFNRAWFRSARMRMLQLLQNSREPKHRAKYGWFLGLWDAVNEMRNMTPDVSILDRLVHDGILQWVGPAPDAVESEPAIKSLRYRIHPEEL